MFRFYLITLFLWGVPVLVAAQTTHTVTNTNDTGPGSLRLTIQDAAPGDSIVIDSSLIGLRLALDSGSLVIDKELKITGPGLLASDFEINGNDSLRVFEVLAGSSVSLSSLTVKDGFAETDGGGLWIGDGANVILTNTAFSGNSARDNGGAIFNSAGATLLLSFTTLNNNHALGDLSPNGGAIYNAAGFVRIQESRITENTSVRGGGIWNTGSGTVELVNSTVDNNKATLEGGGLYNNHKMIISGSSISGNSADVEAGAIRNRSGDSLIVINSTISGNEAVQTGGIYNFTSSRVFIYNSTIARNLSDESGAGLYNEPEGAISLYSSIVATNTRGSGTPSDVFDQSGGGIVSEGFNIVGARGGLTLLSTDQSGTVGAPFNPQLEALFSYGGPAVHLPRSNSLAIDNGECEKMSLSVDQSGNPRINDDPNITDASDGCDVGAAEFIPAGSVSVEDPHEIPVISNLSGAYPNPFSSEAFFEVKVAEDQVVKIGLYNVLAQQVSVLFEGPLMGGEVYTFSIDAEGLAGGVYYYRIIGETLVQSQAVILAR